MILLSRPVRLGAKTCTPILAELLRFPRKAVPGLPERIVRIYCVMPIYLKKEATVSYKTLVPNWYLISMNMEAASYCEMLVTISTIYYISIRSNEMQQYAGVYLLQNYSTCFGCPSHPSPGVHQIVTAASGTGHSIWATTFGQRGLIRPRHRPRWRKVVALTRDMTCTRSCSYMFDLLLMMGAIDTWNT